MRGARCAAGATGDQQRVTAASRLVALAYAALAYAALAPLAAAISIFIVPGRFWPWPDAAGSS